VSEEKLRPLSGTVEDGGEIALHRDRGVGTTQGHMGIEFGVLVDLEDELRDVEPGETLCRNLKGVGPDG
jgi:hypothetical protein